MALYLNAEWARASRVVDMADAGRIADNQATIPDAWIDLLVDDPEERAVWRRQEFRKGL